jgi:hypothetical protein
MLKTCLKADRRDDVDAQTSVVCGSWFSNRYIQRYSYMWLAGWSEWLYTNRLPRQTMFTKLWGDYARVMLPTIQLRIFCRPFFYLLLLLFVLGPLACFPWELIWNYGSYRHSVGFLRRVISPGARLLPTQDSTNTEETRTDIHASSWIRTHDHSVWAGEDRSDLDGTATVIGLCSSI